MSENIFAKGFFNHLYVLILRVLLTYCFLFRDLSRGHITYINRTDLKAYENLQHL